MAKASKRAVKRTKKKAAKKATKAKSKAFAIAAKVHDTLVKTEHDALNRSANAAAAHIARDKALMQHARNELFNPHNTEHVAALFKDRLDIANAWYRKEKMLGEIDEYDEKRHAPRVSNWKRVLLMSRYPCWPELMDKLADMKASERGVLAVARHYNEEKKEPAKFKNAPSASELHNIMHDAFEKSNATKPGTAAAKKRRTTFSEKSLTRGALPDVAKKAAVIVATINGFIARFCDDRLGVTKAERAPLVAAATAFSDFTAIAKRVTDIIEKARTDKVKLAVVLAGQKANGKKKANGNAHAAA